MLRFAADENFHNDIVRGLLRHKPDLDIVRLQEVGFVGTDDQTVLEWAAQEGRVLLTHDVKTIPSYAYERIQKGKKMPGVFEIPSILSIGQAIEEILLLAECSLEGEWEGHVVYLPLK